MKIIFHTSRWSVCIWKCTYWNDQCKELLLLFPFKNYLAQIVIDPEEFSLPCWGETYCNPLVSAHIHLHVLSLSTISLVMLELVLLRRWGTNSAGFCPSLAWRPIFFFHYFPRNRGEGHCFLHPPLCLF